MSSWIDGGGIVPVAELLVLGLEEAVGVRHDGGGVLVHPATAEGIVHEVRGVAAEEAEVGERGPRAEEIRVGGEEDDV